MLVERYTKWHNFPCRVTRFPCFSFLYLEILFRIFLFTYCPAYRILFSISSNYFLSLYVHLYRCTVRFSYFLPLSSVGPHHSTLKDAMMETITPKEENCLKLTTTFRDVFA